MAIAYPPQIFSEVLEFMVTSPSPQDIIAFKPSEALESRLTALLSKKNQDVLSDLEQEELDAFLNLNHFMNMLKIHARKKLTENE